MTLMTITVTVQQQQQQEKHKKLQQSNNISNLTSIVAYLGVELW
jgi:hypothetical protein